MPVIPVNRMMEPKRIIRKNGGQRRRRGTRVADPPPKKKKVNKMKSFGTCRQKQFSFGFLFIISKKVKMHNNVIASNVHKATHISAENF
jgi:hypothetical protein